MTSTFQNNDFLNESTLRHDALRSLNVEDRRSTHKRRTHQVFIGIQAINHEKSILEARKVTKLHYRDLTSSNDEFSSYAQSIKLIPTRSTTHSGNHETLDLYSEGATLSNFIHEGRRTTTKLTFVALPSLTSHSTFYECSRGTPCQPQASPHRHLTRLAVITSYSIRLERRITLLSTFITRWNITTESTQKKLIYSSSKNSTTFQVGIHSSTSLTKLT